MKKTTVALAVAAALVIPGYAAAEAPVVSGFAEINYLNDDNVSAFVANAEADIAGKLNDKIAVRVDVDFALATNGGANASALTGGPADSAAIEQAYFAMPLGPVTILGGVLNDPIGWEGNDAPDRNTVSQGLNQVILDNQTVLYGNSIAGVAVAAPVGPVTLIGAVLNDIGLKDETGATSAEDNSVALVASAKLMEGLNVEIGYVTQQDDSGVTLDATDGTITNVGAGDAMDVNATYKAGPVTIGVDYLTAAEVVDSSVGVLGSFAVTDALSLTARYEQTSFDVESVNGGAVTGVDLDDTTATTVALTYVLADNLQVRAEWRSQESEVQLASTGGSVRSVAAALADGGADTDDNVTLQFIAKF